MSCSQRNTEELRRGEGGQTEFGCCAVVYQVAFGSTTFMPLTALTTLSYFGQSSCVIKSVGASEPLLV